MPKAITLAASVAKSILEVIASLAYTPGSLPFVHPLAWPRCFNEPLESASKEEHATAANERATYKQLGCSTIEQIVFLLLLPNLAGKPPGFVKSIQNAVFADGVINTLSSKINDSLLTDIGTRRVDDGFCAFVGVRWALAEYDTGLVKQLLSPILSPIVEVGSKACMFPKRHPRARLGRYPADPQYILNIKTVLDSEDDTPLADESSGVPWPLPVFPPPTPAPTLSPTAFRPHTPAYNPGPILTQDLHPRRTRTKRLFCLVGFTFNSLSTTTMALLAESVTAGLLAYINFIGLNPSDLPPLCAPFWISPAWSDEQGDTVPLNLRFMQ